MADILKKILLSGRYVLVGLLVAFFVANNPFESKKTIVTENIELNTLETVQITEISESASQAFLSRKTARTGEEIVVKVKLIDNLNKPAANHEVDIISSEKTDIIYSNQSATDQNGQINFFVSNTKESISELTIIDLSSDKTLDIRPILAFVATDTSSEIELAAESDLNAFKVEGLDEQVKAGDSQSITVTAIDEDGFIVTDYVGTIIFSSTDESATLPNDYTFKTSDQGEHTFSLGIKFVTPGFQTVTLTDEDQGNISGEIETEVVTEFSDLEEETDYESDFESEDFQREGDFELISPASGYYSENDIEVVGEADYGFTAVIYLNEEEAGRTEVESDDTFSYTIEDLEDGEYEFYVDIIDIETDSNGDEQETIEETSNGETIIIDTSAPELVSLTVDPEKNSYEKEEKVSITVLSEKNLDEASLVFNEEVTSLIESSTKGKYEGEIAMPSEEGDFTLDINLKDELGNEASFRDEFTFTVAGGGNVESGASGLTATPQEGAITLSWEPAEMENPVSYYVIYFGPYPEALYASEDTYDSSTYWTIQNLDGESEYYFAIAPVDVEGNEGGKSEVIKGIPLAKLIANEIPQTETEPEISNTEMPSESPDTGPEIFYLLLLSLMGATAFSGIKSLAYSKRI